NIETSAFIKGDSLIVLAINRLENDRDFIIKLPYNVISGEVVLSLSNDSEELCQKSTIDISEPSQRLVVDLPGESVATYIFKLENSSTPVQEVMASGQTGQTVYYDLQGRRLNTPRGFCIERHADGTTRKVFMNE
ncbi:MAG: hypothetical protein IKX44_08835, partial [Prevotella sp.]|nr:hypothetical protein [Prevotella sp.]